MKLRIVVAAVVLLSVLVALVGCMQMVETEPVDGYDYYGDYYEEHYRRPITIDGAVASMPSESSGPICGTVGVDYCRTVVLLCSIPYETDISTVRWIFDGRLMPEWNDMTSFPWNFQSTGIRHVKVTIVDEFDRTVVYDGDMRVVSPRHDYENTWYSR